MQIKAESSSLKMIAGSIRRKDPYYWALHKNYFLIIHIHAFKD